MDVSKTPDGVPGDEDPPDFGPWSDPEELLTGGSTRERLLDVIVQLREPTKVSTIAERAGCDTETARDYLEWFASMGLVSETSGRPVRYARNESYFRWRRVQEIRDRYSDEELVEELSTTLDAIEEYRERFDVDRPGEVSLVAASRETAIEDAWEALSEWETLERRADLLDAARRDESTADGRTGRVDA